MFSKSYLVAVIAGISLAQAHAANEPAGYLVSVYGAPVTSGHGDCVRTSSWTSDMTYRQCDPLPAARQLPAQVEARLAETVVSPVPVAAAPEPALVRISVDALFDFDSALLRADAAPALAKLAQQLTASDYQAVNIVGRADRIGRAKYNLVLSEQRAKAVGNYLAAHGIDGTRIAVSGVGSAESLTRDQCKALEGRQLIACLQPDRSAEVTVIGTQKSAMR